jgi:hypothetical protein
MAEHKDHKGIIHTTSYEQLNFIKENVSKDNRRRLDGYNKEQSVKLEAMMMDGINIAI